jgi:hypothetical protein
MRISHLLFVAALSSPAAAQDTLFTENFQSSLIQFTLNTSGAGSTVSGYNHWVVNAAYAGGSGTGNVCGIPVSYSIPATQAQPAGVAGGPNSAYMHTVSDLAIAGGLSNCNYLAADGFCNFSENYFTEMKTDVNTSGYDTVRIGFWWLCAGSANSFGEVYYSTDGGASWILYTGMAKFNNAVNWVYASLTDPAFANQPQLRFGFRFVNNTTFSASDPGFGIDEVIVTAIQSATAIDNPSWPGRMKVLSGEGFLSVRIPGLSVSAGVSLYDAAGKQVRTGRFENERVMLDTHDLPGGVYVLQVATPHERARRKVALFR